MEWKLRIDDADDDNNQGGVKQGSLGGKFNLDDGTREIVVNGNTSEATFDIDNHTSKEIIQEGFEPPEKAVE